MKYVAYIRENNRSVVLETVHSDWLGELRTMSTASAERLMLNCCIEHGANVTINRSRFEHGANGELLPVIVEKFSVVQIGKAQ